MGSVDTGEGDSLASIPFPAILDLIASRKPDDTWIVMPEAQGQVGSPKHYTFGELAQGVNKMALWLEQSIGLSSHRDTIAYLGTNDILYPIMVLALMKTGYKVMLLSVRNSGEAQISLLRDTQCRALLYSEALSFEIDALKALEPGIDICQVPPLDDVLHQRGSIKYYPDRNKPRNEDHVVILHTSGSTGLPKPIFLTKGGLSTFMYLPNMSAPHGRRNVHDIILHHAHSLFTTLPFFHSMGINMLLHSLVFQRPLICMPPGKPASSDIILAVLNQTEPEIGVFAPSVLEELSKLSEGRQALAKLDYILYGGAPLSLDIGNKLIQLTNVIPLMGSTETGLMPALLPLSREDWCWFEWSIESGIDMEHDSEGLYEMVLKRGPEQYQAVFHNFPELHQWRTNDLWERHATRPTLWCYRGRKDDIIVLSNGEKFNPRDIEAIVEGHPMVRSAVVVGQGRFQASLLIEVDWEKVCETASLLLDDIWKTVQEANKGTVSHARIWRSKIVIAKREKPFKRAAKGSVLRKATIELYKEEVDCLFRDDTSGDEVDMLDPTASLETVRSFIRSAFQNTIPTFSSSLADDVDIFTAGADSLQVLELSRLIGRALLGWSDGKGPTIETREIYNHPTVNSLADAIYQRNTVIQGAEGDSWAGWARQKKIFAMVEKYTQGLQPTIHTQHTVILTGSTGSLGNYLLKELISSPAVAKVYCLNRSDDASSRQLQAFKERDELPDFTKVTFLQAIFGEAHIGIPEQTYTELLDSVNLIIHNAWMVDFNRPLESFEENLVGTRHLIDFCGQGRHGAHFFLISSIGSVGNWNNLSEGEVPEALLADSCLPSPQGYGESKFVAERILSAASEYVGIRGTILRAAQIAGSSTEKGGTWNKHEWFPTLVATSKAMGLVPESLGSAGHIDWVPVDAAARIIVELAQSRMRTQHEKRLDVFHLRNPRTSTWKELLQVVQKHYASATNTAIRSIPMATWVEELQKTPLSQEKIAKKPGIKLLDAYKRMASEKHMIPRLAIAHTADSSKSLRELSAVDGALMENWLKQWRF